MPTPTTSRSFPGCGVTATVGPRRVEVGRPDDRTAEHLRKVVDGAERVGHTAVTVVVDDVAVGVVFLADEIRAEAAPAVAALAALTTAPPALLTGDNHGAAERLAAETGVTDVHSALLPSDKVDRVRMLQRQGRRVLVVGDGVNDAPAPASATTSALCRR